MIQELAFGLARPIMSNKFRKLSGSAWIFSKIIDK